MGKQRKRVYSCSAVQIKTSGDDTWCSKAGMTLQSCGAQLRWRVTYKTSLLISFRSSDSSQQVIFQRKIAAKDRLVTVVFAAGMINPPVLKGIRVVHRSIQITY